MHQDVRPVQLVHDDVLVDLSEDYVLVVDQDEQLVQPADHVHDALTVSDTLPPDQGLPRRSTVVDQDAQPFLIKMISEIKIIYQDNKQYVIEYSRKIVFK